MTYTVFLAGALYFGGRGAHLAFRAIRGLPRRLGATPRATLGWGGLRMVVAATLSFAAYASAEWAVAWAVVGAAHLCLGLCLWVLAALSPRLVGGPPTEPAEPERPAVRALAPMVHFALLCAWVVSWYPRLVP